MKRYQPTIAKYGNVTQAEMQENERGQYYLRADVDERMKKLETALRAIASIENEMYGHDWDEIEKARGIALLALGHQE